VLRQNLQAQKYFQPRSAELPPAGGSAFRITHQRDTKKWFKWTQKLLQSIASFHDEWEYDGAAIITKTAD